jgi:hypothetical protein
MGFPHIPRNAANRCNTFRSLIHAIQLHIIWLNYVDREIIADSDGV